MAESVRYVDLQNENLREQMRSAQKSFRQKIVVTSTFFLFLFSMTLLVNRVGISSNKQESDGLCGIEINKWFVLYTTAVACKLLLTIARYCCFKRERRENIPLFFVDIVGMNALMTGIFI